MPKGAPKQRVTFRLESDLAATLKQLPNQTAFVEGILRRALSQLCPICHGTGESSRVDMAISDLKSLPNDYLNRAAAAQLRALVQIGRQLLATELALAPAGPDSGLEFRLERQDELLLRGRITCRDPDLELH